MSVRALTAMVAIALVPGSASAFDNFESYEQDELEGGGGGRYFTGSVSDGYSCAVCHFGGTGPEEVEVEIEPDPFEEGYRTGRPYRIEVTLPDDTAFSAGALELVDMSGTGAGTLELLGDDCTTRPDDLVATHLGTIAADSREVAISDVCGAREMRVNWTAPDTATGSVWLNIAVVSADGTGDATLDHATTYGRVIAPFGTSPEGGRTMTVCSAAPGHGGAPLEALIVACALALMVWRRR